MNKCETHENTGIVGGLLRLSAEGREKEKK